MRRNDAQLVRKVAQHHTQNSGCPPFKVVSICGSLSLLFFSRMRGCCCTKHPKPKLLAGGLGGQQGCRGTHCRTGCTNLPRGLGFRVLRCCKPTLQGTGFTFQPPFQARSPCLKSHNTAAPVLGRFVCWLGLQI